MFMQMIYIRGLLLIQILYANTDYKEIDYCIRFVGLVKKRPGDYCRASIRSVRTSYAIALSAFACGAVNLLIFAIADSRCPCSKCPYKLTVNVIFECRIISHTS